jgi:orotate phosphoribosyltransferase
MYRGILMAQSKFKKLWKETPYVRKRTLEIMNLDNIDSLRLKLKNIIRERSFKVGKDKEFTLASGIKSKYYFNLKKTTLNFEGRFTVASLFMYEFIIPNKITAVGGLESGAIPLAGMIVDFSPLFLDTPLEGFYVKKSVKKTW